MLFGMMLYMRVPTAPFLVLLVLASRDLALKSPLARARDRRGDRKNQSKYQVFNSCFPCNIFLYSERLSCWSNVT